MISEKGRGCALRLKQERLLAKGGSRAVAAVGWHNQRHDTASREQVQDGAFGRGDKGNRLTGDGARRLDLCLDVKRRLQQDRIKGAPGVEHLATKLKAMGGGYQGDSQADDIASPIKLDIWWELGRRCSSSSWLTWSEARRAAGATGLPRVTCCTMGRHSSSCSQRSCPDRRSAIVSSAG